MIKTQKTKSLIVIFSFVFFSTVSFLFFKNSKESSAASTQNFKPGNIISDDVMSNFNSMSEADIQNFLNSKNSCNKSLPSGYTNEGNGFYSNTFGTSKKYIYHIKNGKFVCLSQETFGSGNDFGKGGETAAHIIWQTAQDYRINPQVLLVLLEKEQGLISDDWPNNYQYQAATGYGCPDTSACDSKYYGFKNQIRNAANLFRTVLDGGWTNYPVGNNYIQYNPNQSCGGSVVNIENRATSALYRYTPYQPNQATLNAGYGTAPCGAYGNRNFYLYFSDWFGDPRVKNSEIGNTKPLGESKETYIINPGLYTIRSSVDDYILEIANGVSGAKNGTNIQLYQNNGTLAQVWRLEKTDKEGEYFFINPTTNKVIDLAGANTANGGNINLYEKNNTCSQKWKLLKNKDGSIEINSTCKIGKVIDVDSANFKNGTNIQIYESNGTNAQKWHFESASIIEEKVYEIKSKTRNELNVDISGGAERSQNTTNIQVYEDNNTEAQKWKIRYNNDGTYTFVNPYSNKVLDVSGASVSNGTNVHLYEQNGTCAQKWYLIKKDDYYIINSSCSSLVLDISGGSELARNNTNIQVYEKNGTNAQKWYFE